MIGEILVAGMLLLMFAGLIGWMVGTTLIDYYREAR